MSSILISKPQLCLNYMKLLSDPRVISLTHLLDVPSISKVSEHGRLFCTKGVNRPLGSSPRQDDRQRRYDRQRDYTLRERPSFPKSVFAAGTAKRTAEFQKKMAGSQEQEEPDRNPKRPTVLPERPLAASEWRKLQETAAKPERFAFQIMTAIHIRGGVELGIAKSLLAFVATETGTLPYELLLRYLTLCVTEGHHDEVFDLYDIMRANYRTLDTGAYSLFVKGLSRTDRWRQALDMLRDIERVITPSPRNYGDVIEAAVRYGDVGVAWALYDEVLEKGLVPRHETWQCLFQGGACWPGQDDRLQAVLMYMRENQVYPSQGLARTIDAWFHSLPDQSWRGSWTTVDPRGVCRSCGEQLESIQLTEEEYGQLRERVMQDIIHGRDVFKKTTPEELNSFMAFVKRKPVFDIVIDGLNLASVIQGRQSETLLAVVCELEKQGKAVLVLGRRHMQTPSRSWNRHHMAQIQQRAHCFFTDNISEDDPFLLYATLHSGNHCNFLSRDLMRDHKACLPDSLTRRLFFKWQRGHQLVLDGYSPGRRVRFQRIPSYDTIVQSSGRSWHIPYDEEGTERSTYEIPQRWLCLRKTH